jgi:hypothetical protein
MATPFMVDRYPGVIEMAIITKPQVASYRFGAANTLDTAFTGVTTLFDVPRGTSFRSPTLTMSSLNQCADTRKGQTRASVDMADYASATVAGDSATSYFRVSEINHAGTVLNPGPIFVVPPPYFNTSPYRTLSLSGTAPNIAATTTGLPPTGAMVISLPCHGDTLTFYNDDSDNSRSLFVSLGAGQQEIEIPFTAVGDSFPLPFAGTAIYIRAAVAGAVPFRLTLTMVSGLR